MAKVFLLGDSTCAQKSPDVYPETGWGMCFGKHLAKGWTADNRAINGRSTKMFLDEGAFAACLSDLHGGDYGIIQFGHNENKMDEERHTEPWTSYSANLRYMAQSILQKGGHPVFPAAIFLMGNTSCIPSGIILKQWKPLRETCHCLSLT